MHKTVIVFCRPVIVHHSQHEIQVMGILLPDIIINLHGLLCMTGLLILISHYNTVVQVVRIFIAETLQLHKGRVFLLLAHIERKLLHAQLHRFTFLYLYTVQHVNSLIGMSVVTIDTGKLRQYIRAFRLKLCQFLQIRNGSTCLTCIQIDGSQGFQVPRIARIYGTSLFEHIYANLQTVLSEEQFHQAQVVNCLSSFGIDIQTMLI